MSPEDGSADRWRRSPFEVPGPEGGILRGEVRQPHPATDRAIVVCHGFKGFKDWGFFPYLADRLAQRTGALVVSFNFSGSGIGPDLETFSDLEAFACNTFSRELSDLGRILDGLAAGRLGQVTFEPPEVVGLIGHSRGAAAAVLVGAARPEVRVVVTWAGIGSVFRYEDYFAEGLEEDGVMQILNARTGQRLPLYRDVLDDMRANRTALDMEGGAALLGSTLLIVHGTDDEAVPIREAYALHGAAPGSHLAVIEGAGHTMDASHPFPGSNPRLDEAVLLTVRHFNRFLAEDSA